MTNIEQLIEQLSRDAKSVNVANTYLLMAKVLAFIICYSSLILVIYGFRPDIRDKLSSPAFLLELVLLGLVVITTSISALFLSFPDMYQKRWLVATPILSLILFIGAIANEYINDISPEPEAVHSIECLLCITMFSVLPAIFVIRLVSKRATTHYYIAGLVCLIFASSFGGLILRLAENTDSVIHLIKWHYLPMLGFGIIGLWLGRKFLKW